MLYRFGECELDPAQRELRVGGQPRPVEPQVFDILVLLVGKRDRMVSKEELFEEVWPDRVVSDATLSSRIKAARQAIGDDGERQEFIRTIHGRGFRFTADVVEAPRANGNGDGIEGGAAAPHRARRPWADGRVALALSLITLAGVMVFAMPQMRPPETPPPATEAQGPIRRLVVLPFADLSEGRDQEYLADGMTDEIMSALGRVAGLKVVGRTSSYSYKGMNSPATAIGATLGVDAVVEGSLRREGDTLRIRVQLTSATDGYSLWSQTYDRKIGELFETQSEIAEAIAQMLAELIADPTPQRRAALDAGTANIEAYVAFLQATHLIRERHGDALPNAVAFLEEAISLDPSFARAHAALAEALLLAPGYELSIGVEGVPLTELKVRRAASLAEAERRAQIAASLNPDLGAPVALMGLVSAIRAQPIEARLNYERALAIDPGDSTARVWYAIHLYHLGRLEEARREIEAALTLDPVYALALAWRAQILAALGEQDEAMKSAFRAAELGHALGYVILGDDARRDGRGQAAIENYGKAWRLMGFDDAHVAMIAARYEALLSGAQAREGIIAELDAKRAQGALRFNDVIDYYLAGEVGTALEAYVAEWGFGTGILLDQLWKEGGRPMRTDPGFPAFADAMGMTAYWREYGPPALCTLEETLVCR